MFLLANYVFALANMFYPWKMTILVKPKKSFLASRLFKKFSNN